MYYISLRVSTVTIQNMYQETHLRDCSDFEMNDEEEEEEQDEDEDDGDVYTGTAYHGLPLQEISNQQVAPGESLHSGREKNQSEVKAREATNYWRSQCNKMVVAKQKASKDYLLLEKELHQMKEHWQKGSLSWFLMCFYFLYFLHLWAYVSLNLVTSVECLTDRVKALMKQKLLKA